MTVPPVFHRVWLDADTDPIPEAFEEYWERLQALHPGWTCRSWERRDELVPLLRNRELFESFPEGEKASFAFRADVARYELLARFGGIYIDTDVEPLRNFGDLLDDGRPFIAWCSGKELDPSVIASPAHHPAIELLVDDLAGVKIRRANGTPSSPPGTTGPTFVTARWRDREDVRRLPPSAFFPFHWADKERGHRRPPWPESTYAIHHWATGWK